MMGDFFEKQFQFADKFNLLNLNDAEIGLLTSILILNPGDSLIRNRNLTEHNSRL